MAMRLSEKPVCVGNRVPSVIWMVTSSLFIASFSASIHQTHSTCTAGAREHLWGSDLEHSRNKERRPLKNTDKQFAKQMKEKQNPQQFKI